VHVKVKHGSQKGGGKLNVKQQSLFTSTLIAQINTLSGSNDAATNSPFQQLNKIIHLK